ncbi:hypothetical protein D9V28_03735 [Mycetocola zhadangensis]|uniref:Uncharacterized protein n=1 Tax=Mycetocola zhadangensis TaxID=1164595 RepID=A0A3L7J5P3_9MICO|nr:hypothetical protein D9V28_03735 [Mycetocola zhadangensis]
MTADAGIELLASSGLDVAIDSASDLVVGGVPVELKVCARNPSPSDAMRMLDRARQRGVRNEGTDRRLLIVMPSVPTSIRKLAEDMPDLAVAGVNDSILIWGRKTQFLNLVGGIEDVGRPRGRPSWGRHALMRALLFSDEPRTQVELAAQIGTSQAAVSRALKDWTGTVEKVNGRWRAVKPEGLWDRFLETYPGPSGITESWYSLDPIIKQAEDAQATSPDVLLSGDAAADTIAPWRVPTKALVYAKTGLPLARAKFAESGRDEASLEVIIPADPTIWATAAAWSAHPRTVDPVLAAWDVRRTGGPDAGEAIDRLARRVLQRAPS